MRRRRPRKWIRGALGIRRRRLGLGPHHRKAVRVEGLHKGLLHKEMGYAIGEKIPLWALHARKRKLLRDLARVGPGAEHDQILSALGRVHFAINQRHFKHREAQEDTAREDVTDDVSL